MDHLNFSSSSRNVNDCLKSAETKSSIPYSLSWITVDMAKIPLAWYPVWNNDGLFIMTTRQCSSSKPLTNGWVVTKSVINNTWQIRPTKKDLFHIQLSNQNTDLLLFFNPKHHHCDSLESLYWSWSDDSEIHVESLRPQHLHPILTKGIPCLSTAKIELPVSTVKKRLKEQSPVVIESFPVHNSNIVVGWHPEVYYSLYILIHVSPVPKWYPSVLEWFLPLWSRVRILSLHQRYQSKLALPNLPVRDLTYCLMTQPVADEVNVQHDHNNGPVHRREGVKFLTGYQTYWDSIDIRGRNRNASGIVRDIWPVQPGWSRRKNISSVDHPSQRVSPQHCKDYWKKQYWNIQVPDLSFPDRRGVEYPTRGRWYHVFEHPPQVVLLKKWTKMRVGTKWETTLLVHVCEQRSFRQEYSLM